MVEGKAQDGGNEASLNAEKPSKTKEERQLLTRALVFLLPNKLVRHFGLLLEEVDSETLEEAAKK